MRLTIHVHMQQVASGGWRVTIRVLLYVNDYNVYESSSMSLYDGSMHHYPHSRHF